MQIIIQTEKPWRFICQKLVLGFVVCNWDMKQRIYLCSDKMNKDYWNVTNTIKNKREK